jgi:hypothetical protein
MEPDRARARQRRLRLAAAIAVIVVFSVAAVHRSSGTGATTTVLEIAAAVVIGALILLAFSRRLGNSTSVLDGIRSTEPVAYPCYFENGKRGIVSIRGRELVIRRFAGKRLVEDAQLPVGTYTITPAKVQLTAVRQVDGVMVSAGQGSGGVRLGLSQDKMTLLGNMLAGADLERAMASLQHGAPSAQPPRAAG